MSGWRTGRRSLDDDHAAMIAGILHREPGEVMALCAAERAKEPNNRARWLRVAALLAAAVMPPAAGATSHNSGSDGGGIGIMSTRLRRFIRRLVGAPGFRLA
jgi:hypothetical protein